MPELTFAANQINNRLLTQPFEVFAILAVVYYVICWSLTKAATELERRITDKRAGARRMAPELRPRALTAEL